MSKQLQLFEIKLHSNRIWKLLCNYKTEVNFGPFAIAHYCYSSTTEYKGIVFVFQAGNHNSDWALSADFEKPYVGCKWINKAVKYNKGVSAQTVFNSGLI